MSSTRSRWSLVCQLVVAAVLVGLSAGCSAEEEQAQRPPNIVWIIADDMSPHIGAWGYEYAQTPNLDSLAQEGIRYTNAYATNPVCSPSRSALITGLYATTTGTHNLRSTAPLPDRITGFPDSLQEAGYFTVNRGKTDYNTQDADRLIKESWDEVSEDAHWRDRSEGEPFFAVFNPRVTHQSRISFLDQQFPALQPYLGTHDSAEASLPPYYPDTPIVRETWARYNDAVTAFDHRVGELLGQLEEDGLADSTIVFVFSDHGMGLPRGKRMLTDSGLQVPLIVHVPEAYSSRVPDESGTTTDRLVSFVDFPPTVLRLAGLNVPEYMQGKAFLGEELPAPRSYVYGARDRVDEAIDMSRSVRTKQYLYVRNYFPHISWGAPEFYSDRAPIRQEIHRLAEKGRLNEAQYTYAGPSKPTEALFDVTADPHQIHNLAGSPAHQDVLRTLRGQLRTWMRRTHDLGFLPEEIMMQRVGSGTSPLDLGNDAERYPLDRILEAARLVGDRSALQKQAELLRADHPAVRFWAAAGLHAEVPASHRVLPALETALGDESPPVQIEVASTVLSMEDSPRAIEVLTGALQSDDELVALRAARALQLLGDEAAPARNEMTAVRDSLGQIREATGDWPSQTAWYIYESVDAALRELPNQSLNRSP